MKAGDCYSISDFFLSASLHKTMLLKYKAGNYILNSLIIAEIFIFAINAS